jgi:hypothetical protein
MQVPAHGNNQAMMVYMLNDVSFFYSTEYLEKQSCQYVDFFGEIMKFKNILRS